MARSSRPAFRYGLAAIGVIAVGALTIAFFPWHLLRHPLERYMSGYLQREVTIDNLDVSPGWTTHVEVDGLTIANAPWSDMKQMAYARRADLYFSPWALLKIEPDAVKLWEPEVLLEKNTAGGANWQFGDDGAAFWPHLQAIDVDRGKVRYLDPRLRADVALSVQTESTGETPMLHVKGRGKLHGEAFELEVRGKALATLRRQDEPYPLVLTARAGATKVDFDGSIVPQEPENLRGSLHLQGQDLSQLYPIVPSPLPWTPPYKLQGELAHGGKLWAFRRFKGVVGDSDLAGEIQIDVSTARAKTIADFTSSRFNYKDLGGFIGLPPGEATSPRTPEQEQEARKRAVSGRVLPDRSFDFTKLRAYDADVKFRGTAVKFGDVPMNNLVAHLTLTGGVLRFDPLDFGFADGHIVSNATLDANPAVAKARGQIDVRNVELKRIFPKLASPQGSAGRVAGRVRFETHGNSVAQMFAALDGAGAFSMRGGEASTLALVMTNLDLARAVVLLLKGDETAQITCAVAGVHAKAGIITPDVLFIDSSAMLITGAGSIDLGNERYDLRLTGDSKKPSLMALGGPIVIGGTFKNPVVRPALTPAITRIAAAIGLGVVAPPLALLPLVDVGDAADIDCRAASDEARAKTGTTERIARGAKQRAQPKRTP